MCLRNPLDIYIVRADINTIAQSPFIWVVASSLLKSTAGHARPKLYFSEVVNCEEKTKFVWFLLLILSSFVRLEMWVFTVYCNTKLSFNRLDELGGGLSYLCVQTPQLVKELIVTLLKIVLAKAEASLFCSENGRLQRHWAMRPFVNSIKSWCIVYRVEVEKTSPENNMYVSFRRCQKN